jgi:hypothetical protein
VVGRIEEEERLQPDRAGLRADVRTAGGVGGTVLG